MNFGSSVHFFYECINIYCKSHSIYIYIMNGRIKFLNNRTIEDRIYWAINFPTL